MIHKTRLIALSLAASLLAGAAGAQPPAALPADDAALAAKLASDEDLADQNRRSEALNHEINAKNHAVDARNAAAKAAFDRSVADYQAELSAQAAANAKVKADYDKRVAAWQADVAACKAGEVKRCAAPTPDTQVAAAKR